MNRKERRAARSNRGRSGSGAQSLSPGALTANLFASAIDHFNSGRLDEAERLCRDVLMFDKRHFDSHHMLGMIATRVGNLAAAGELFQRALAINDRSPECHYNIAQVLQAEGHPHDAIEHLGEAIRLRPDYVAAHAILGDLLALQHELEGSRAAYQQAITLDPRMIEARHGLANVLRLLGRLDESAAQFRQVVELRPDFAEAISNLGVVLAAQGNWAEAAEQYQRALALRPDLVDVYRNLARALLNEGRPDEALATMIRGVAAGETDEGRAMFVQCAQAVTTIPPEQAFRDLVGRALTEGWGRSADLSPLAAFLAMTEPSVSVALERMLAEPELTAEAALETMAILAAEPLVETLLTSAPVRNPILERILTRLRSALLRIATEPAPPDDERTMSFAAALAQQCFINEYVFAVSETDDVHATTLARQLAAAVDGSAPVAPVALAALASIRPLHGLAGAASLQDMPLPPSLAAVLRQQIEEPAAEREIAASVAVLTPIDDAVSIRVRGQYEDMPYPRWIRASVVGQPTAIDWYLRSQFPNVAIEPVQRAESLDVLIAGCGTGQHAVETAQRFDGARVLAIDLSRASLAYAIRKSRAAHLRNIEYAQADILRLGTLDASFDVIESSGVLHHLSDPVQGWRILLSLLRPGGVMHIGLYSELARSDIRAARALIIDRGYGETAADIRRARQELLTFEDGTPLKNVSLFSDFYATGECRDLLFHVQERPVTIAEIKRFVAQEQLNFLGFTGPVTQGYRRRFPEDAALTDLERWEAYETDNPMAFVNMYQFWVQRRGS